MYWILTVDPAMIGTCKVLCIAVCLITDSGSVMPTHLHHNRHKGLDMGI